jgi:hypothetical protein
VVEYIQVTLNDTLKGEKDMQSDQNGFYPAWESLLLDFEEVLVGNAATEQGAGTLIYPVFDRPFSIVKLFHHPAAEMGLELRADGYNALLTMFRQQSGTDVKGGGTGPESGTHDESTEIGKVSVNYDELLDVPDNVMARVLSFLPPG